VVEFQEARASSREDPTQSVSASPMIANHQQQSTTEAPVHTISLEQKPEACSIMPPTRITPDGNWAVGLQVLNFIQIAGLLKLVFLRAYTVHVSDGIYGTHNLCSFCSPRLIPVKS